MFCFISFIRYHKNMNYPKEQFEKEIENLSNFYSKNQIDCLLKDLSDCLVFSCVFAGNAPIFFENIKIEKKSDTNYTVVENLKNVKKENLFDANKYVLKSYDGTITLNIITSKKYFLFNRVNDIGTYVYKMEYFFDDLGNFTRKGELNHERLGKQQTVSELSFGTLDNDLYFSNTIEKIDNLKIFTFKLPNKDKTENIYLKYQTAPDAVFMCRTKPKFKKVPYLEIVGMNTLSDMMVEQFEEDEEKYLPISDEEFFNKLQNASNMFYKKTKKS